MAEEPDSDILNLERMTQFKYVISVKDTEPSVITPLNFKYVKNEAPAETTEEAPPPPPDEETNTPKFTKVQIRPGRAGTQDQRASNYVRRLPLVEGKAAPYTPMPYVFRIDAPSAVRVQNMWARCPPFHVLLDHTVAVVWLLFTTKEYECPLGIAQLQWALAFLRTIHTRQGDHPKDVQTCIDAIENNLLQLYADMAEDMQSIAKIDEGVQYLDGAVAPQSMVVKSIPFSLNYAEMMAKNPVDKTESKLSMTSDQAKEELDNLKKAAGVASIESLDTTSKHMAVNVLRAWKSEQLEKIRGELKRLRSIEDKMKTIDDNFEGYLEDDFQVLYEN